MPSNSEYVRFLNSVLELHRAKSKLTKTTLSDSSGLTSQATLICIDRLVDERLAHEAISGLELSFGIEGIEKELGKLTDENKENGEAMTNTDPKKIFVVHGRNHDARDAVVALLRAMSLEPIHWNQAVKLTGSASPSTYDVVQAGLAHAQAVVIVLTGDDQAQLASHYLQSGDLEFEKNLMPQARPNVIFEAGMAFAMDRERTLLLRFGDLRPWTDLDGINYITVEDDAKFRYTVRSRLEIAGCNVGQDDSDFLDAGKFTKALQVPIIAVTEPTSAGESLPEWLLSTLTYVAKTSDCSIGGVAQHDKISQGKAQFRLGDLLRRKLVWRPLNSPRGYSTKPWKITQSGLALLDQHDLL